MRLGLFLYAKDYECKLCNLRFLIFRHSLGNVQQKLIVLRGKSWTMLEMSKSYKPTPKLHPHQAPTMSTGGPQGCVLSPLLFRVAHDITWQHNRNLCIKFIDNKTMVIMPNPLRSGWWGVGLATLEEFYCCEGSIFFFFCCSAYPGLWLK